MNKSVRSITAAVFAVVLGGPLFAAHATDLLKPKCSYAYGMCAYVDAARKEVTASSFDRAEPFHEGLAVVGIKGKFGYVAEDGQLAIPLKFDFAGPFYQGMAPVEFGGKIGIIDRRGGEVLPPLYGTAIPLATDAIIVSFERTGAPPLNDSRAFLVQTSGKYGIINRAGQWLREPELLQLSLFDQDGRGLIWAKGKSRLFGLLDSKGKWVIEPRFETVQSLKDQRAVVTSKGDGTTKWGLVGERGQIVLEPTYEWLSYLDNGRAFYRVNGKLGLVDQDGKIVVEAKFDQLDRPDNDGIAKGKLNSADVFVNAAGEIFEQRPTTQLPHCPDGRAFTIKEGKFFALVSEKYFTHKSADYACNAPTVERLPSGRFAFIAPGGKKVFEGEFDQVKIHTNGVARVVLGQKWGVVDWKGAFLIPLNENLCPLATTGLGGLHIVLKDEAIDLDRETAAVLGRNMARLEKCIGSIFPCSGVCPSKIGDQWGYVDDKGVIVLPPKYDYAAHFRNGRALVAIPEIRKWCEIDPQGKIIDEKKCSCGQSLIIFELNWPSRNTGITDCYEAGLYDVGVRRSH